MMELRRLLFAKFAFVLLASYPFASGQALAQQQPDIGGVVRGVDASVQSRIDRLAGYTVTEHYAVFRGKDEAHPAAEMLVKTTYTQADRQKL